MEKRIVQPIIDMLKSITVEDAVLHENIQNSDEELVLSKEELLLGDNNNPPIIKNIEEFAKINNY